MRSIASILAVMVIAAALAPGAEAGEKIRLAQSSTVTNCMMTCNSQVANCRTACFVPTAADPAADPAAEPLQFDPYGLPDQVRPAIAVALKGRCRRCGARA
jgi:hypothetical protein